MNPTLLMVMKGSLIACFLLVLALSVMSHRLYRALRTRHHQLWLELGSPSLFLGASLRAQNAMRRFIWRGQADQLDDPALAQLTRRSRALSIAALIFFLLGAAIFFAVRNPGA